MEPFRIIVDRFVYCNEDQFTTDYKHNMINILNRQVKINGKMFSLIDAIAIYCRSIFDALENKRCENIKFYEL